MIRDEKQDKQAGLGTVSAASSACTVGSRWLMPWDEPNGIVITITRIGRKGLGRPGWADYSYQYDGQGVIDGQAMKIATIQRVGVRVDTVAAGVLGANRG